MDNKARESSLARVRAESALRRWQWPMVPNTREWEGKGQQVTIGFNSWESTFPGQLYWRSRDKT